jgi:hypothetical protein
MFVISCVTSFVTSGGGGGDDGRKKEITISTSTDAPRITSITAMIFGYLNGTPYPFYGYSPSRPTRGGSIQLLINPQTLSSRIDNFIAIADR